MQENKFRGVLIYQKISSGGNQFGGVHFYHDRCFGYPREHNFGLVLILSPTGYTEGCVYFPQSCRNTHFPHFLDCLLNTTLIPCLLVCFLSILHERVCDYSGVQSSVTGILRVGDMNIHITWLTHVRTGPKKK